LLEELKVIAEHGYAIDNSEHEEGVKCFAAPVNGYGGDVVGAISATGLQREFDLPEDSEKILVAVRRVASEISRVLGHVEG